MEIYRLLGERIRSARLKAGLTQPQLAELLGVSKGIISRWETGLARTSLDRLAPLAQKLNISEAELLGFAGGEETATEGLVSLPVWEVGFTLLPDFTPTSTVGRVSVTREEAAGVDGAFYIKDFFFPPYLLHYDLIGVQRRGKPKVGDLVFVRFHGEARTLILRRFGGKRSQGYLLLPLDITQKREIIPPEDVVAIYRWLRRPGKILSNH